MVPVVARAWKAEARVPAARVRSKAIAAQTSQALLGPNLRRLLDGVTAARPQARAGPSGKFDAASQGGGRHAQVQGLDLNRVRER